MFLFLVRTTKCFYLVFLRISCCRFFNKPHIKYIAQFLPISLRNMFHGFCWHYPALLSNFISRPMNNSPIFNNYPSDKYYGVISLTSLLILIFFFFYCSRCCSHCKTQSLAFWALLRHGPFSFFCLGVSVLRPMDFEECLILDTMIIYVLCMLHF